MQPGTRTVIPSRAGPTAGAPTPSPPPGPRYRRSPDQDAATPAHHPVVVVGAGPVGLALAIDLAQHGVPVVLLDDSDRLPTGSRAICFAKRTLEIFDRLGCADAMVQKGVSWRIGKVFLRSDPLYQFDLLAETGHQRPAFINLQQYHVEAYLAERCGQLPLIDPRRQHAVVGITQQASQALLTVQTPDGRYQISAQYVAACDGSRSTLRQLLGLESTGRVFRDRFLIADVKMALEFPAERWFWFDPPFHPGHSVLLHKQPDSLWRIDFQLGWDADPQREKQPQHILPRIKALLAHSAMKDADFTLEWASVYTFACQRLAAFRHGRVLFAGDAAHGVSPFGARGANSGVQDADNLAWKLAYVLQGRAGDALLDSYGAEREAAADENIGHSSRATDFITPKSEISRLFRDATLDLARQHPFARTLVNSGRLSVPAVLQGSALNTADRDVFASALVPGAPAADAPLTVAGQPGWLLRHLAGPGFHALVFDGPGAVAAVHALQQGAACTAPLSVHRLPADGLAAQRYDARPGTAYLLRPDQHVCARWRRVSSADVRAALQRALGSS